MPNKLYSTMRGLKSKKRFSSVQRISLISNDYAIRDYKKKTLIPIHKVAVGKWLFNGKKFNKLSDINWRHCHAK
jgi:hypothetical protein